jgi:alpha-tubulin suppressor-like RCC1 family protein
MSRRRGRFSNAQFPWYLVARVTFFRHEVFRWLSSLSALALLFATTSSFRAEAASCFSAPAGLVGWWPGEGSSANIAGTNQGTLQGGATANAVGVVGLAFSFDGTNGFVQVASSSVLQPANLTIEAWVLFSSLNSAGSGGSPAGDQYLVFKQNTRSGSFEGFDLSKTRVAGGDVFRFLVTSAAGLSAEVRSATLVSTGVWYHVAAARGSNFLQLYVNGVLERQTNVAFPQDYGSLPLYFGTSGQPAWDHKLKGSLDEVSLYNRALSSNEVAALYAAGAAGKCKAPSLTTQPQSQTVPVGTNVTFTVAATGFGLLSYQWQSNGVPIAGATGTSLTLTNVQLAATGNYTVAVTNSLGSVTSAVAVLTVMTPPSLELNPLDALVSLGATATFGFYELGTPPFFYQWQKDGTNLVNGGRFGNASVYDPFGNNPVLSISPVQHGDEGLYHVSVSNAVGVATSTDARLWIIPVWGWGNSIPYYTGALNTPLTATNVLAVSGGYNHSLVLRADGSVLAYGTDDYGQTDVSANATNLVRICAGGNISLALREDGTILVWGGGGVTNYVPPAATNIVAIAGDCALRADGTVIGLGGTGIPASATNIVAISQGIALRADGTLLVWSGVGPPPGGTTDIVDMALGYFHGMAVRRNGTLVTWGSDGYGAVTIPPNATNVMAVAANGYHSLVLRRDGTLVGWSNIGAAPSQATNIVAISAGVNHALGLIRDPLTQVPPRIFAQPSDRTVLGGDAIVIHAGATGALPLRYQWLFNGATLPGQTNSWISFTNLNPGQMGGYQLAVANDFGSVTSAVATVTVTNPLRITVQPSSQSVFVNGTVAFTAAAGGTTPLFYRWQKDGQDLFSGGRIFGVTGGTLTIVGLQTIDAGNYQLVVTNAYATATSSVATLTILLSPTITLQPTNQTLIVGSNASFAASATGDAPLSYQWYRSGILLVDDARHSGSTSGMLSISNLQTADAGNYTFVAANPGGTAISQVAVATVIVPPAITTQPRGWSVPVGLPVTFTAAGSGTAPLSYQWRLNGAPIANATKTSLTISNILAGDAGNYQLVVTNGGGANTSVVAQLTLGPVATWGAIGQVASVALWPPAGLSNVIAVAAGSSYSLALRGDGTVLQWGANNSVANVPANLSGIVGIAAGLNHALALRSNGTLVAWGLGSSGQTNVPAGLSNVVAVTAGNVHSAALRSDGTVVVWGGDTRNLQTNIPPGLMKVKAIDAGSSQTLALREDGKVVSWGGTSTVPIPAGLNGVMGVAASLSSSGVYDLVLFTNGTVVAWGDLGAPTNMPAGLSGVTAVDAGGLEQTVNFAMALRSNGTVVAWGSANGGVTNVPTAVSNAVAIAAGASHAVALLNDGRPLVLRPPVGGTFFTGRDLVLKAKASGNAPLSYQWSKDGGALIGATAETLVLPTAQFSDAGSYQLIVSNALGVTQSVPVPVTIVDSPPVLMSQPVSRFAYYGSPFSVGASIIGSGPLQLQWLQNGVPTFSDTNDLVFEHALPQQAGNYQLIASNAFGSVTSSVAQITFSRVVAWGNGPILTNAPVDLANVRAVASGYFHALAIQSDGTVAAWGTTANGATNVPAGLSNVVAVSGGSYFSVALKNDGTVAAWGLGSSGQTNVPVNLSNVVAIAAGGSHSLALRADGTVAAWGINSSGQLNVPANLSNVVAIAAGSAHSLALRNDGSIVGWGTFGKIPAMTNVVAIAAGFGQSLALQADGTVLAWSTTGAATSLPSGISNVVAISVGGGVQGFFHSLALKADGTMVAWGNNSVGQLNVPGEVVSAISISAGGGSSLAFLNDRSPVVTAQTFSRHVASGTNVTLAALAVGQPALNYQWRFNGTNLPGATNRTLTLAGVNRNSRGNYSALVSNALGVTNSQTAQLEVGGAVRLLSSATGGSGALNFSLQDSFGGSLTPGDLAWLEVQAGTNLVDWVTLPNALIYTNGVLILNDAAPTSNPARFYRIMEH